MAKIVVKELDFSSGNTEPDQVEIYELMADESQLALESDLTGLFLALEKEINRASQDTNKN